MQPNVIIDGPQAAVCSVPYVLGFQPESSAVLLWIAGDRLVLAQRVDLPAEDLPSDRLSGWARDLCACARPSGGTDAVMVVVRQRGDGDELPQRACVEQVAAALRSRGTSLRDALLSDGDRWWSYLCTDSACCPPEGCQVSEETSLRIQSAFAFAGVAPMADRAALVAEMAPDGADAAVDWPAMPPIAPEDLEAWRDAAIDRVLGLLATPPRWRSVEHLADLAVSLHDVRVRDTVLWNLASWGAEELHGARALLAEATRGAPRGLVAPVATCCAVTAWTLGDGARAVIALERALRDDAQYPLGLLVAQALRYGMPPSMWTEAMGQLTGGQCRSGLLSAESRAS